MTTLKCKEPARGEVTLLQAPRVSSDVSRCELKFAIRHDDPATHKRFRAVLDEHDAVARIAQGVERRKHYFVITVYVRVRTKRKTGLKPREQGYQIAQEILTWAAPQPMASTPDPRSAYKSADCVGRRYPAKVARV